LTFKIGWSLEAHNGEGEITLETAGDSTERVGGRRATKAVRGIEKEDAQELIVLPEVELTIGKPRSTATGRILAGLEGIKRDEQIRPRAPALIYEITVGD